MIYRDGQYCGEVLQALLIVMFGIQGRESAGGEQHVSGVGGTFRGGTFRFVAASFETKKGRYAMGTDKKRGQPILPKVTRQNNIKTIKRDTRQQI